MQFLFDKFKEQPNKEAFIHDGRAFLYGDIESTTNKYYDLLSANGVKPSEVVAFVGDYSPEIFCFILALAKNRNIMSPMTPDSVVEKDQVLKISEANWFVSFSFHADKIEFVRLDNKVENPLTLSLVANQEPGLILFSSGSTGTPKGIIHNFNKVLSKFKKPRSGVTAIVFLMLDHFGGINTILGITSSLGTVVTLSERSVKAVCETIEKYRVELLPTTPSFLNMLVHTGIFKSFDLSSLKKITYGTEVMPQATLDRLGTLFPNVILQQTYGLSELGVLSSKSRGDGTLWVKVGGEGFSLKVKEEILWIKSDFAMLGYLNAPSPFDQEGWFNTQDRVEVDGEYFKILGRVTDLINVGGQKVYPSEIENVILEMDNIEDVSVYSEYNPLLGHLIVAKVKVVNEENVASVKKRIRKRCSEVLTSFKVPAKVLLTSENLYSTRQKKIRTDAKESTDVRVLNS